MASQGMHTEVLKLVWIFVAKRLIHCVVGNFIFDFVPETKNAFVLGGGSGHGFKHTPALGKLIAEVLSRKEKIPSLFLLNSERK
jgi:hypothetical protein